MASMCSIHLGRMQQFKKKQPFLTSRETILFIVNMTDVVPMRVTLCQKVAIIYYSLRSHQLKKDQYYCDALLMCCQQINSLSTFNYPLIFLSKQERSVCTGLQLNKDATSASLITMENIPICHIGHAASLFMHKPLLLSIFSALFHSLNIQSF